MLALLCLPAGAHAAGTITATAGGTRSAVNTDSAYAVGLDGVAFQKADWVSDPATASWSALCTTGVTGACTSASLADGRYLVRQAPGGAPAGWRALTQAAWGGSSSGTSATRDYVGDATVSGADVAVHPSTAWSPTAGSSTSGDFIAAKDNPPLPERCGLDVLLLLDRSGSIGPQKATYSDAAKQFVSALSGTPTRLKITSFAAGATADQATFLDLDDPADVATANARIDSVYASPAGGTNWDAGMKLAAAAGVEVVVFITDGNPTLRDTGGTGSTVNLLDLTSGVASANKVKTEGQSALAGATILAVGAGTGVTASNLAAVSGPTEGTDYVMSSVAGLDAKLQELANKLCGARIHVRKLTDEADASAPKPGWTFTPGKPAGSPVTFSSGSVTTAGRPAESVISVDRIPAGGASAITVAETQKAGYAFVASQCQTGGFADVTAGGTVTATIPTVRRTEDWYCTFRNRTLVGAVAIVKTGTTWAYHGDTLSFTFAVTNAGESPLTSVAVSDDHCSPLTLREKRDSGGNPDPTPSVLDLTDTWVYECSMPAPAHTAREANPIVNTATVTAQDPLDHPVSDTDQHSTRLLHPAIAIDKTGPATAQAGQPVSYTLAVTNPGDVPFLAPNVTVTDALCEAPPVLTTTNGDTSPGQLDPGDTWTYTCTVRTLAGQTVVDNVGVVTATDSYGGQDVTDSDPASTVLTAPPVELPAPVTPPAPVAPPAPAEPPATPVTGQSTDVPGRPTGTARLSGNSRCVSKAFSARVTGRGIAQVQFLLDGKHLKTVKSAPGRAVFKVRITPSGSATKSHRVTARVSFKRSANTRARTMRFVYVGCPRQAIKPPFAG